MTHTMTNPGQVASVLRSEAERQVYALLQQVRDGQCSAESAMLMLLYASDAGEFPMGLSDAELYDKLHVE